MQVRAEQTAWFTLVITERWLICIAAASALLYEESGKWFCYQGTVMSHTCTHQGQEEYFSTLFPIKHHTHTEARPPRRPGKYVQPLPHNTMYTVCLLLYQTLLRVRCGVHTSPSAASAVLSSTAPRQSVALQHCSVWGSRRRRQQLA